IASNTFPMHYLGDQSQSNLATSASVELPVLKLIEEEQEIWEGLFRTLAERVPRPDRRRAGADARQARRGHGRGDAGREDRRVRRGVGQDAPRPRVQLLAAEPVEAGAGGSGGGDLHDRGDVRSEEPERGAESLPARAGAGAGVRRERPEADRG